MGAMPWNIVGPYDADPEVALARIQHQYFDHNYDLPATIASVIEAAEACVAAVQVDDEYNLLGTYTATLHAVKRIAKKPIPEDKDSQIALLRKLVNSSGIPLGNILDIEGVSKRIQERHVFPLPHAEIQAFFGTIRPSRMIADRMLYKVYDCVDRAQTVSFVLYRQRKPQRPLRIMYVGYTAD